MKREEISDLIETRRNEAQDGNITLGRSHVVQFTDELRGEITVDYKPSEFRLTEDSFDELTLAGFFQEAGGVETVINELYWALVDVLYPQSSYLDEPWKRLPMVVEATYDREDHSDYFASVGTLR